MFYRNVDDLVEGAMIWGTLTDQEHTKLKDLINTYWDAYHNPPEGIIGVGKITYAEQQLVLAQEVAA